MTIMKNLKKVHAAVAKDNIVSGKLGTRIGLLAVEAITGGVKSEAWRDYMSLFADNPEQLERLISDPPPSDESYLLQLRAYIVSNAICAADTGTFVADRVDDRINGNVSDEVDVDFVAGRLISIPNV